MTKECHNAANFRCLEFHKPQIPLGDPIKTSNYRSKHTEVENYAAGETSTYDTGPQVPDIL